MLFFLIYSAVVLFLCIIRVIHIYFDIGLSKNILRLRGGLVIPFNCSVFSLLEYDTVTKEVKVLMEGLRFPNGVQLSPAEDFVLVAETVMARIRR